MGKQWKQWLTLFWGPPKSLQMVTAAMKLRLLLLGRKVMTNLDSVLKSRDITLSTKVRLVKAIVFPVVMYGCESWIIQKAECQRIDAFELWCWRRLLRVPWTARRSNQCILKEISPGCSLEGLMLKLKLRYFGDSDAVPPRAALQRLKGLAGPTMGCCTGFLNYHTFLTWRTEYEVRTCLKKFPQGLSPLW